MYNVNYIDGMILKRKYGSAFVRFLKIANFFVHLAILVIVGLSIYTYLEIEHCNIRIEQTKKDIETKRTTNKISDIEREWETYYYKICAVREQLEKHTNYGFVFRDLGAYMPSENSILNLYLDLNNLLLYLTIKKDTLKSITSFYDYNPTLVSAFEKSSYLGNEVTIQDLEDQKVNSVDVKVLKTSIQLKI